MKTCTPICSTSLLLASVIWAWIPAAAQTVPRQEQTVRRHVDRSRQASTEALQSSQAGDSHNAIEIVHAALQECPAGAAGSACRGLLNYTLGYIVQQQGQRATTADDRLHALNSATASYQAALQDDPGNSTVHYNLALLLTNLGDQAGAVAELQRAVQADPTQWQYRVKIGDLQVQQKNWEGAMQAYEQAAQSAPAAEGPAQRVLDLTRRGHGLNANELQARCKEWEVLYPTLAPNCYEQFMIMVHAENSAAAETALVSWVDIVARQDKVDEHLLEVLPQNWNTPTIPPLSAVLRGDLSRATTNWWTEPGQRSEAWARFLLAVGQQSSPRGPQAMEETWQTALKIVRGDRHSASSLELRRALALLYVRYPDLDPTQNKLKDLVEQIFVDKMGAIQSNDLEAEQRYHTVLGLIFAGQQKWGSDYDPYSAAFQLRRTVEVAEERYRKEAIYQPLPEIKELRVKVYEKTNLPAEAARARWEAILAYMDSDQLDRAAHAIEAFQSSGGYDTATLRSLLKLRRDAIAVPAQQKGSLITALSSLGPKTGVSPEFLQRQQFKALADLVTGSPGAAETESVQAALQAFSLAVEQHVPLIGVNDLGRWQAVQQKLVDSVGGRSERIQVRPGGPGGSAVLKLALPGSTVPQRVEVSPQTLQAAHVARVLGPEILTHYSRSLSLADGKLAVPDAAMVSPAARQELEMKGVRVMAVPH
jgi:tetratricopeptide (TPR) repeat protein